MHRYTIEDLQKPIVINTHDAGYNLLETAIYNTFHEDCPYACLDDLPYVEYNPDTGEVEVDDTHYKIHQELQDYLNDAREKLNTIPLPQIKLRSIELKIFHPEKEGEKGSIKIGKFQPTTD